MPTLEEMGAVPFISFPDSNNGQGGDSIRSKTDTTMVNEVLCKVLCHNLVVLIHEMYELGIDPVFWSKVSVN